MTESRQLEALNAKLSQCQARHREKLKLTAMLQETNQQLAHANRVQKEAGEILRQA